LLKKVTLLLVLIISATLFGLGIAAAQDAPVIAVLTPYFAQP